jgi:hypothetical protein
MGGAILSNMSEDGIFEYYAQAKACFISKNYRLPGFLRFFHDSRAVFFLPSGDCSFVALRRSPTGFLAAPTDFVRSTSARIQLSVSIRSTLRLRGSAGDGR